ncbi:lasso peptide biosynthesis B2 protein [Deinococcus sonorensis]|uniref:Lasso peptide biosynthesis B2 protein n=2 Tax=Deinococcus sonorensis TaxID=309891 RepID=A0AAU7UDJ5_9DEIO
MTSRLAALLLQDIPDVQPEDIPHLQKSSVVGELCARLPADHPMQVPLRAARLGLSVRNERIRQAMRPLLEAWHRQGIRSILLKGFAFAEFEYPQANRRFFGDVDVLLHEKDLRTAIEAARSIGWTTDFLATHPQLWSHEMAHLFSPGGKVRLDVHRALTILQPRKQRQQLTSALWAASREVDWNGIPVGLLDPRDMALHLALSRAWSGDRGFVKPADYVDLRQLILRHQLTPDQIEARAQKLGLTSTWQAYQSVCNPWLSSLHLGDAQAARRLRQAAERDGRQREWQRVVTTRLRRLPPIARALLQVIPDVVIVSLLLRRRQPPQRLLKHWTLSTSRQGVTDMHRYELIRGVFWLTRLLYPRSKGDCVPKAMATHRALVRRGYPAVFVSGVRRMASGQIEGHAWVEGPDGPLDDYERGQQRLRYEVLFEHRTEPMAR